MIQHPPIWTVGHSNHDFERFADLVDHHRIAFLLDVRSYPYSRFAPHFNREQLQATIGARGISYVFLGLALGGAHSARSTSMLTGTRCTQRWLRSPLSLLRFVGSWRALESTVSRCCVVVASRRSATAGS
jgi:hypothetical protein